MRTQTEINDAAGSHLPYNTTWWGKMPAGELALWTLFKLELFQIACQRGKWKAFSFLFLLRQFIKMDIWGSIYMKIYYFCLFQSPAPKHSQSFRKMWKVHAAFLSVSGYDKLGSFKSLNGRMMYCHFPRSQYHSQVTIWENRVGRTQRKQHLKIPSFKWSLELN